MVLYFLGFLNSISLSIELYSVLQEVASVGHFQFSDSFSLTQRSCLRYRLGNKVNIIFAFMIVQLSCCRQLMFWCT